jgi:SAM-dependent methyltransferase
MDQLAMFPAAEFDIVIHPVSTCYVPDVAPVYREVARITREGGLYISQHKQPASLQGALEPSPQGYELREPYYRNGPLPPAAGSRLREEGTLEYLHRWEQLLGLLCRSGFVIEDLVEPFHADATSAGGEFGHRCRYLAPYVRIKARRKSAAGQDSTRAALWVPGGKSEKKSEW